MEIQILQTLFLSLVPLAILLVSNHQRLKCRHYHHQQSGVVKQQSAETEARQRQLEEEIYQLTNQDLQQWLDQQETRINQKPMRR